MRQGRDIPQFNPHQVVLEEETRGHAARGVRNALRRMEPVALHTPRWSCPQAFLEDLALDLAVGEPAVGCRTVSLRPLARRERGATWQFILRVLAQLGAPRRSELQVPLVAERRGFQHAARELLEAAQERSSYPVALLAHGAEHLPLDVAEDLMSVWGGFRAAHLEGCRCVLLLGGAQDARAMTCFDGRPVELADFGGGEAERVLRRVVGQHLAHQATEAARFSGGMPALVEGLGQRACERRKLEQDPWALLATMGPVADEIRGVIDIVASDCKLAERLDLLLPGEALQMEPELDKPLLLSGLVRKVRARPLPKVMLRAPAVATLVG